MQTPATAANSLAEKPKSTADPEAVYVAAVVAADCVVLIGSHSLHGSLNHLLSNKFIGDASLPSMVLGIYFSLRILFAKLISTW